MWGKEAAKVEANVKRCSTEVPTELVADGDERSRTSCARKVSLTGALNYARPRPFHIPRRASQNFTAFREKQEVALRIGLAELERQVTKSTGIARFEMTKHKLTVHLHSQSKLSQQELQDLQKATHFDKKELQQWYKGTRTREIHGTRKE